MQSIEIQVPLLFEALPTRATAGPAQHDAHLRRLEPLRDLPLRGLLVPHVEDGDYATIDPRGFARSLRERTGLPTAVAKVTVDQSLEELLRWTDQAQREYGVHDLLLVGGRSHRIRYDGPGVDETLRRLRLEHGYQGDLAVVTIPTRRRRVGDEPHRLLRKQRAGASYAISQILFEPDTAIDLRRAKRAALAPGEGPGLVYWSLAPVRKKRDVRFLEGLGVHFPAHVKTALLAAPSDDDREAIALDVACKTAAAITRAAGVEGHGPTGFCISHVMDHNIEAAQRLVRAVAKAVEDEASTKTSLASAGGPLAPAQTA